MINLCRYCTGIASARPVPLEYTYIFFKHTSIVIFIPQIKYCNFFSNFRVFSNHKVVPKRIFFKPQFFKFSKNNCVWNYTVKIHSIIFLISGIKNPRIPNSIRIMDFQFLNFRIFAVSSFFIFITELN